MTKVLITGSAGHLGEALARKLLADGGYDVVGLDVLQSKFTTIVGSIVDRDVVRQAMQGVEVVFHIATLHKPHVATHSNQKFIDVNVTGTLNLLEEAAAAASVRAFVFTSSTSVFGDALSPKRDQPAAWIDESVQPVVKNIYGASKLAAENLCELFHRNSALNCVVLRTSRFFPEIDDDKHAAEQYDDANLKLIEFLYRRADIEDVVSAHVCAAKFAERLPRRERCERFIVSAPTPFRRDDVALLRSDPALVLKERVSTTFDFEKLVFAPRNWKMLDTFDRVYDSSKAVVQLGWQPKHSFVSVCERVATSGDWRSETALFVGSKGYHR